MGYKLRCFWCGMKFHSKDEVWRYNSEPICYDHAWEIVNDNLDTEEPDVTLDLIKTATNKNITRFTSIIVWQQCEGCSSRVWHIPEGYGVSSDEDAPCPICGYEKGDRE